MIWLRPSAVIIFLVAPLSPSSAGWSYRGWYDGQPENEVRALAKSHGREPPTASKDGRFIWAHLNEGFYSFDLCGGRLAGFFHSRAMTVEQARKALEEEVFTRGRPAYTKRGGRWTDEYWSYPDYGVLVQTGRNENDDAASRPIAYLLHVGRHGHCKP